MKYHIPSWMWIIPVIFLILAIVAVMLPSCSKVEPEKDFLDFPNNLG